jgi:Ca2+-binding RTX toxin-like protein
MVLGGDETISGSGFSDLLYGGKGNDTLLGNKGVDELIGGAGNDVIDGGQQSDLLIGGAGADRFVFGAKSGMDLVLDFDPNSDKLDLTALGFSSLDDVLPGQGHGWHSWGGDDEKQGHGGSARCWQQPFDHGDVVLDLGGGNMVKLIGVSASELNSDNVLI